MFDGLFADEESEFSIRVRKAVAKQKRGLLNRNKVLTVCWGAGWDSTAMLIEMKCRGIRPDLITFADHGGEKNGTYKFIPAFVEWCKDADFPEPVLCKYEPLDATAARYRAAVVKVATRLGITLTRTQLQRLSHIYGNMVANWTLPGIAFGPKSCSIKWKVAAQEPIRMEHPMLRYAWEHGETVQKLIGFDCTEDHRTYADSGKMKALCPGRGLPTFNNRYDVCYPLREWGMDRDACGRTIVNAGLPLPPKSACFFCPAMRAEEIQLLAQEEPVLLALALEMERIYRKGKHFRGDNVFTVTGKHRITGERYDLVVEANDPADAREQFRAFYDDTARPYRYTLMVSQAVVGLGRSFAWKNLVTIQEPKRGCKSA